MPGEINWADPAAVRAEAARRAARREAGLPLRDEALERATAQQVVAALEKDEQRRCWRRLRGHGFVIWYLSQARRTRQTKGLPDLLAFHEAKGLALWLEVKRRDRPAPWTEEQRLFARLCAAARWEYVRGGEAQVVEWLTAHGIETPPLPPSAE